MKIDLTSEDLLLIIDPQIDFCPGGKLAIADGDQVIPLINRIAQGFQHIIVTQDWHPAGHSSFASTHPGNQPYEVIQAPYGPQTLWPDHCIQSSLGADFHPQLNLQRAELILRKGFRPAIDSYSAFFENDKTTPTGLAGYLRERDLKRVFLAGLAYDFCVGFSAIDAARAGFSAFVIEDACRPVNLSGSVETTNRAFETAGVTRIHTTDLGPSPA
jgi:nicotinamidase/pyrazinamidase